MDLVDHDAWSRRYILTKNRLQHDNVNHIILMQTGNRNCDTTGECLKLLSEMEVGNITLLFFYRISASEILSLTSFIEIEKEY